MEQVTYRLRLSETGNAELTDETTPTTFKFNDKGQLIEQVCTERHDLAGGAIALVTANDAVISYDSAGRISKIVRSWLGHDKYTEIGEATYDDAGNLATISTRTVDGEISHAGYTIQFNTRTGQDGAKIVVYSMTDGPGYSWGGTIRLFYDKDRHLLDCLDLDWHTTPDDLEKMLRATSRPSPPGTRYIVNDKGDLATLESSVVMHYEFAYEYDGHGNWTSRTVTQVGQYGRGSEPAGPKEKVVRTFFYGEATSKPAP
jgi:hypothetical protein